MMRKMILLGAALSLWIAGNTHAAVTPRIQVPSYQAARVLEPQEPGTHSLLLVTIMLLSLRMRVRSSSEKFST